MPSPGRRPPISRDEVLAALRICSVWRDDRHREHITAADLALNLRMPHTRGPLAGLKGDPLMTSDRAGRILVRAGYPRFRRAGRVYYDLSWRDPSKVRTNIAQEPPTLL